MARYKGQLVRTFPGDQGADWVYIDDEQVPIHDLDEWFIETMLFTWHEQPFKLSHYQDGLVTGYYLGHDNSWAQAHHLDGDPTWATAAPSPNVKSATCKSRNTTC
jgi:hypothetical protein